MTYNIISTGSHGNAVVINDIVLIDCGVSYKAIAPYADKLQIVLLTHIHGDHFCKSTIKRLAFERPTLRFGCGIWLQKNLLECGVPFKNIDSYSFDKVFDYSVFQLESFFLTHDVPNCGYRLYFGNEKILYATDTNSLNGIVAKNFDVYFVEANHTTDDIDQRIAEKIEKGQYAYEIKAKYNHLSKEKTDEWLLKNAGDGSEFIYMHEHRSG